MSMFRSVGVALFAVAAVACAEDTAQPGLAGTVVVAPADTVRLGVNGSARIGTGGAGVKFVGIGEDSRCPIDALCVWPGTAEARLELSAPGQAPTTVGLHSYSEPRSTQFAGYRIRLLKVEPSRSSEQTIDPLAYVIELELLPL